MAYSTRAARTLARARRPRSDDRERRWKRRLTDRHWIAIGVVIFFLEVLAVVAIVGMLQGGLER